MIGRLVVLGACASLAAAPVFAGEIKRLPAQLNPAKAYVIVELGGLDDALLPGTLTLAPYDADKGDIVGLGRAASDPPRKISPHQAVVKPLVKSGPNRLCLVELDPGLWVIEAANDTAFSLGSSTLQLAPGSVTDLGVANIYTDFPEGEKHDIVTTGRLMKGALMGGLFGSVLPKPIPKAVDFRPRTASDMPLPPLLAAQAHGAEWADEVRFGNFLGGLINRMGGRKARPGAIVSPAAPTDATSPAPITN
jgi:hypothetical protein